MMSAKGINKLKPKVSIEYFEAGKKSYVSAIVVDKKGNITKTKTGENEDALEVLKKFVAAL